MTTIPHPPVVSKDQWWSDRVELLAKEKELTKHYDRINAQRRRLPMVKLESEYIFFGPDGEASLRDLFEDKHQLIVYHFMFAPEWEKGCPGCTSFIDALGDLSMLGQRNTRFVAVSRGPLAKLERYKDERGWSVPWYSSAGSDFNYDFQATLDDAVEPMVYNFKPLEGGEPHEGHGLSVFFRMDDELYHTYSCYARGCESVSDAYRLLDLTPYGRQEDFEDSPEGWPQKKTYGGWE